MRWVLVWGSLFIGGGAAASDAGAPPSPLPAGKSAARESAAKSDGERPDSEQRETVITATRSPERVRDAATAVELITRRDIESSGARDVAELLAHRPGIEVRHEPTGVALQLQGLGPEYTLVLVDGERLGGRLNGQLDLSRLTTDDIEQVEIVKGPSSILYGSDAVAGVVNIVTRKARRPLGAEARMSYGGLRTLDTGGELELRSETHGLRLSGGFRRRDAYGLSAGALATTGSALQGFEVSARGDTQLSQKTVLEARVDANRRVLRGVDSSGTGAVFDRAAQDEAFAATVGPRFQLSPRSQLSTSLHYSRFRHRFVYDQRSSGVLDRVEETREQLARMEAQWTVTPHAAHQLIVGAELLGEQLQSDRLGGRTAERARISSFVQDTWRLPTSVPTRLVPGIRWDFDSQFSHVLTPRLAMRMAPSERLTLRASYGLAFRAPSFQELLIDFENPSVGYRVAGNPELRPESSRGLTFSSELRPHARTLLWVGGFHHQILDKIVVVSQPTTEGVRFAYDNVSRARVQGLESGWKQTLPGRVTFELGYTLTDGRDASAERALEGQAQHRLTAGLGWSHRAWGVDTSIRGAWVGKRPFYEDENGDGADDTVYAPSYSTVDAQVSKSFGERLRLFVASNNLTQAGDARFLPIPPRLFYGGFIARL